MNAIELLNLRPRSAGFAPPALRRLFPEPGRMAGHRATARVGTVPQAEPASPEGQQELWRLVAASPKPAEAMLRKTGSFPGRAAHCGEALATRFQRLGAAGLVPDCATRDAPEAPAGLSFLARRGARAPRMPDSGSSARMCL